MPHVTVWNIGDATADNVNVSCYENGDKIQVSSDKQDPSLIWQLTGYVE